MSTNDTLPALDCATCGAPAVGVCNVILAQPISMPYCARCVTEGLESWDVMVGAVYMMFVDPPDEDSVVALPDPVTPSFLQGALAPWAVQVIERSLSFHQKTWEDLIDEAKTDADTYREEHPNV